MIWSRHDNAFYRGTIIGSEVRGVAYFKDGKKMGTFLFRLIRQPG